MPKSSAAPKKKVQGTAAKHKDKNPNPSNQEVRKMIEKAAYFKAEQRNFASGFEEMDWYEAEQEVISRIGKR